MLATVAFLAPGTGFCTWQALYKCLLNSSLRGHCTPHFSLLTSSLLGISHILPPWMLHIRECRQQMAATTSLDTEDMLSRRGRPLKGPVSPTGVGHDKGKGKESRGGCPLSRIFSSCLDPLFFSLTLLSLGSYLSPSGT